MKKVNKFLMVAIVLVAAVSIQSCKKSDRFYSSKLEGTWTMTSMNQVGNEITINEDDTDVDGELLKEDRVSDMTNTTTGFTGTETVTKTYDSESDIKTTVLVTTFTNTGRYYNYTINYVDSSQTFKDTSDYTTGTTTKVVFNDDETFTMTSTSTFESESDYTDFNNIKNVTNSSSINVETQKGSWAFIGADDNQEFEKNQRIGLWLDSKSNNDKTTTTNTFVDMDTDDTIDPYDNTTHVSDYTSSSTINSSSPDMVWELIERSKEEMTVTFVSDAHETGTTVNTSTVLGVSTSTTSKTDNKESYINKITMSKE